MVYFDPCVFLHVYFCIPVYLYTVIINTYLIALTLAFGLTWLHLVTHVCTWFHLVALGCDLLQFVALGCTWLFLAALGCTW